MHLTLHQMDIDKIVARCKRELEAANRPFDQKSIVDIILLYQEWKAESFVENEEFLIPFIDKAQSWEIIQLIKALPKHIRDNTYIVRLMVAKEGVSIQYASKDLQNDRDLVLVAVNNSPYALHFLQPQFKSDKEIVRICVSACGNTLQDADFDLQRDRELLTIAVSGCSYLIEPMVQALMQDAEDTQREKICTRDMIVVAVKKSGRYYGLLTDQFRHDPDIIKYTIQSYGMALMWVPSRYRASRDIVLQAVTQNGKALRYADPELQCDREIVKAAFKNTPECLKYASMRLRHEFSGC